MLLTGLVTCILLGFTDGILFPQVNERRLIYALDGLWWFVREPANSNGIGLANGWYNTDLSQNQVN